MIDRVKKSFNEGVKVVKWIASFVAERTRAETTVAKLLFKSSRLESRLDELYRDIGKRVLELKEKVEAAPGEDPHRYKKSVFKDFIIKQTIDETKILKKQIEELKDKAKEASELTE